MYFRLVVLLTERQKVDSIYYPHLLFLTIFYACSLKLRVIPESRAHDVIELVENSNFLPVIIRQRISFFFTIGSLTFRMFTETQVIQFFRSVSLHCRFRKSFKTIV